MYQFKKTAAEVADILSQMEHEALTIDLVKSTVLEVAQAVAVSRSIRKIRETLIELPSFKNPIKSSLDEFKTIIEDIERNGF